MDYVSIMTNIIKIIVFILVAGAAIFVAYMNHKKQIKEHFTDDNSGIETAFMNVLDRKPNQNEIDYFTELSRNGYTIIEFETLLTNLKSNIIKAYKEINNQDPTKNEVNGITSTFTTYNYTYNDILKFVELRYTINKQTTENPTNTSTTNTNTNTNTNTTNIEQQIVNTYISVYNRDPTPEEIQKNKILIESNNISIEGLKYMLLESYEYKNMQIQKEELKSEEAKQTIDNTYPSDIKNQNNTNPSNYDMHKDIISIYQKILNRNPTPTELNKSIDEKISMYNLEIKLKSSDEYKNISKNSVSINDINQELVPETSEIQYEYMINTQYQKVYNRNPTKQEIEFFKQKMKLNNFDEVKLYNYIVSLNNIETNSTENNLNEKINQNYNDYVYERNNDLISNYNSDRFIGIDKGSDDKKYYNDSYLPCRVSPLMDQTSLIGTLLEEAAETQVGSIMPKFVYKNVY
jgi:hypothetical protein